MTPAAGEDGAQALAEAAASEKKATAVLERPPVPDEEPPRPPAEPDAAETVVLKSVPLPALQDPFPRERRPEPATTGRPKSESCSPSERITTRVEPPGARLVDASCVLASSPVASDRGLPSPARPLNGPIILGALSLVTGLMLPLTAAFESNRMFGILGFCMSGFFLPFPPIAWIAGLAAEKRRREQRLRVERRVLVGRLLGQGGTLLLIAEGTIGLLLIAALRLSGKFPDTFWAK
jgi:hypothetical protein